MLGNSRSLEAVEGATDTWQAGTVDQPVVGTGTVTVVGTDAVTGDDRLGDDCSIT